MDSFMALTAIPVKGSKLPRKDICRGPKKREGGARHFCGDCFSRPVTMCLPGGDFLELIDGLLGRLSTEEFLKLLPELRLAFSYFTPMETDRIAGPRGSVPWKERADILRRRAASPEEYAYGETLDHYIREQMKGADL